MRKRWERIKETCFFSTGRKLTLYWFNEWKGNFQLITWKLKEGIIINLSEEMKSTGNTENKLDF